MPWIGGSARLQSYAVPGVEGEAGGNRLHSYSHRSAGQEERKADEETYAWHKGCCAAGTSLPLTLATVPIRIYIYTVLLQYEIEYAVRRFVRHGRWVRYQLNYQYHGTAMYFRIGYSDRRWTIVIPAFSVHSNSYSLMLYNVNNAWRTLYLSTVLYRRYIRQRLIIIFIPRAYQLEYRALPVGFLSWSL